MTAKITASADGTKYFTGIPCKRGHISERYVSDRCCVECKREREKEYRKTESGSECFARKAMKRRHNEGYKKVAYASHVKRNYGITIKEFDMQVHVQKNRCAICSTEFIHDAMTTKPVVDHDHETGKVRGLLCRKCNQGIGNFGENREVMKRAIEYVQSGGVL